MTNISPKLKLLYLEKIFREETDEEHGLTMPQLIERLADFGINAERKSLYTDIKLLQDFGHDIIKLQTSPISYAMVSRSFEFGELQLLADAVQSSRFLTKKKSDALVESIGRLGSHDQATALTRSIHVEGRIKMQNESVFYNLDAIQRAIAAKKKIEFQYFKYDLYKERQLSHDGDVYVETPVQMTYSDGCYYMIVFNDKHDGFANYRVDRMLNVEVSKQDATRNERISSFDIAEYEARVFGMFSGDPTSVTLVVKADAMGAIVDRFGRDIVSMKVDAETARVSVMVMESPTFFGWLAQFGDRVKIARPAALRDAYLDYLKNIIQAY